MKHLQKNFNNTLQSLNEILSDIFLSVFKRKVLKFELNYVIVNITETVINIAPNQNLKLIKNIILFTILILKKMGYKNEEYFFSEHVRHDFHVMCFQYSYQNQIYLFLNIKFGYGVENWKSMNPGLVCTPSPFRSDQVCFPNC